jgi:acetolactate synthase I/II/III large subunit
VIVETTEQVEEAIEKAWDHEDSVVIDFRVEREANVFPIVPQGKGISEMLEEAPEVASSL